VEKKDISRRGEQRLNGDVTFRGHIGELNGGLRGLDCEKSGFISANEEYIARVPEEIKINNIYCG
jgi:hypothetical protein